MSTDLRTELNDCDNVTGWTSTGSGLALNTTTGDRYEGTGSIEVQHSNANATTYTSQTSGGGGTFNLNLSNSTVYVLLKDSLVNSFANGGVQIVLGDGTDRIGYYVGGNNAVGLSLSPFFQVYKLDVSVIVTTPGSFAVYAGSEANLAQTAVTQVGIGTLHLAKAVGTVPNLRIDRITYITNGNYALRINGGTSGTPMTMATVVSDDIANGWGMVGNPLGKQYQFFAPTEWGNPTATANHYFSASDEQWFWIGDNAGGHTVAAGNFNFRVTGNSTDTESFVLTNVVIVNTGTRAAFDISSSNVNTLNLTSVTFTNLGAITGPAQSVGNKTFTNITLNNCDQANLGTVDIIGLTVNGTTDANGAIILDTAGDSDNIIGASFTSDGTGHAIYITATGSYDFDNWQFSGYGADGTTNAVVYNNSGGAVTINILNGGDTPTVRNGTSATTTINNSVTVAISSLTEGTAVVFVANETAGTVTAGDVLSSGFADGNGEYSFSINYEGAFGAGLDVIVRARNQGIAVAAILDDGGVFTDQTSNANSSATSDMTLTTNTAQSLNDAYYFAADEQFNKGPNGTIRMKLDVTVAHGAGNPTITWEYWNGSSWSSLTFTTSDPNPNWTSTGIFEYEWNTPGNWATTTVNLRGPYYYIRARVSTAGTSTNGARGRKVTLDSTRYLPFVLNTQITSAGLNVVAVWNEDTIAKFSPND